MARRISIYGLIAGIIIILGVIATIEFGIAYLWLGYLIMFIAFSAIFVAVKQYRDDSLGGVIRFHTALMVGLGITTVSSLTYVMVWELYLLLTEYAYIDDFMQSMAAPVADSEALSADAAADLAAIEEQYRNPLFRLPITFLEVFPPGLLVSLVTASVLRNSGVLPKHQGQSGSTSH